MIVMPNKGFSSVSSVPSVVKSSLLSRGTRELLEDVEHGAVGGETRRAARAAWDVARELGMTNTQRTGGVRSPRRRRGV